MAEHACCIGRSVGVVEGICWKGRPLIRASAGLGSVDLLCQAFNALQALPHLSNRHREVTSRTATSC